MKLSNHIINYATIALMMIAGNYQLMAQNIELSNEQNNTLAPRQSWNFIAYLDDEKIGYHNFEVVNVDGETVVNTQAKFDVSFMFIPLYSYTHTNKEIWRNGCLVSLDSSTLDDGEELFVRLSNINGTTSIITPDKEISKTDCIRSFAYWDYELINSKALLNVQTGELIDVSYTYFGSGIINVKNQPVDARQYQLKGKDSAGNSIDINLWYSSNNQWLALESRLDNGRSLRYELKQETIQ